MWTMLRVMGLWVGLWALAGVAQAGGSRLTAPDGEALRIAPGASGVLRVRVQGTQVLSGGLYFADTGSGEYSASAAAAGCPALEPMTAGRSVTFDPTLAGGDLHCEYTITRQATSINDISALVYLSDADPDHSSVEYHLGVAPSLTLATRQESVALLPDGRARGLVRVFLGNHSSHAITALSAGACFGPVAPFAFDGDVPDGCGDMGRYAGLCFMSGYGLEVRPFPANSATSCLVQLTTTQQYTGPVTYPIDIVMDYISDAQSGGQMLPLPLPPRTLGLSLDRVFADGFD